MSPFSRDDLPIVAQVVTMLAERCEALAGYAAVGAVETVGHLVSYLDAHPNDLEPFLNGGFDELPPDWLRKGDLTYHAMNGNVVHPSQARRSEMIRKMLKWENADMVDPAKVAFCSTCGGEESFPHDHRPDNSGLDDGPWLPGRAPRKKSAPKPPEVVAAIRARAWATRREKYGERGHG